MLNSAPSSEPNSVPNPVWNTLRLGLLGVLCGGALLVLAKAIATPKTPANADGKSLFSESVPIEGWQQTGTTPIKPEPGASTGQKYQYQQGANKLDVQVRYELGDGNVSRFLFVYSPVRTANANLQVRYQPGVGHYGVLAHEGRAYLSSCINPRGESTVTEQQFTQNRYQADLQVGRLVPWLLGQEPLLDRRCLWTLMSVPLPTNPSAGTQADEKAAFKTLETAWGAWQQWWRPNFPPVQAQTAQAQK